MEYKDYYKVLGVEKKATEKEIQKAFRNLSKKYHPDVNKEKTAEKKFKEINEAYEVLSDKNKRQKYDTLGANWDQYQNYGNYSYQDQGNFGGQTVYGTDFSDFFEIFFGGQASGTKTNSSILDSLFGGAKGKTSGKTNSRQTQQQAYQQQQQTRKETPDVIYDIELNPKEIFEGGKKKVRIGEKELNVNIPKGIEEGKKLRIPVDGSYIYLKILISNIGFFKLEKKDITCEVPITDYEAVLGTEINVPTLSGGSVNLKVPQLSQSGKTFRLKNLGMYHDSKSETRGDMYVKLKVTVPKNLSEAEKEIFQKLKELRIGKDSELRSNLV
jgi:curved DNA-binding protein